jgi:membrane peptidoglycan carboxypeptidase
MTGRTPLRSRRPRRIRVARAAVAALLALLLIALLAGVAYELSLPSVGHAQAKVAAIVEAHHGTIGTLPLPSRLAAAVVAVEDEHFYSNAVVNVLDGAGRAALATLHGGDPGGSTVAQQLAKELYGKGNGFGATLKEVGLGMKLSTSYSRVQVLNMYLNAGYYGNGYWGDVAAARGYFGVEPRRLDWAEAAMLAGLLQAPSAYDPLRHYRLGKQRQRHVLDQLVANGYLSARKAQVAYRAPLPLQGAGHLGAEPN